VKFANLNHVATYVSANSFTVPSDLTSLYTAGRRLMVVNSSATVYVTVLSSAYTSLTTVTLKESTLSSGTITSVSLGITTAGTDGDIPDHSHDGGGQGGSLNLDLSGIKINADRIANLETIEGINDVPNDSFTSDDNAHVFDAISTGSAASGQKDIALDTVTGLVVGMSVDILHLTDQTKSETNKIASINTLTLTMTTNLANTYPASSAIKRNGLVRTNNKRVLPNSAVLHSGDGRDGVFSITASKNIHTTVIGNTRAGSAGDGVERKVSGDPTGGKVISVASGEEDGFATGDLVLVINKQGNLADHSAVGNYQITSVASTTAGTINVTDTLNSNLVGSSATNYTITIVRIPQYSSMTFSGSANLISNSWYQVTGIGGIVAVACNGPVTFTAGGIDVWKKGFAGGSNGGHYNSGSGEGNRGRNTQYTNNNNGIATGYTIAGFAGDGTGGAGGGSHYSGSYGHGGGHGVAASSTGTQVGGLAIGNADLTEIHFGGGGGGEGYCGGSGGATGGVGGGICLMFADTITMASGTYINANGKDGLKNCSQGSGGGAGGTVLLRANTMTFAASSLITATGGNNLVSSTYDGAVGRIRLEYGTIDGDAFQDTTEENDACDPNPGSAVTVPLSVASLSASYRSAITAKTQRDVSSIDLWARHKITTSHGSTAGTASASIITGITAGQQTKYGVGDTVVVKLSTGKYLENTDGTTYDPKVTSNSTSGQITVDAAIPTTFSGATLQRIDCVPRASVVASSAAESMEDMSMQFVEATPVANEVDSEWYLDKSSSTGQDVTVELNLSVEDASTNSDAYISQYGSNLNYS
jgi:hypothetical protein